MVLFSITKNISTNLGLDQIAGKYPISDDYFLLSYEPDFGIIIRDLKEKLFKNGTYNQLFRPILIIQKWKREHLTIQISTLSSKL